MRRMSPILLTLPCGLHLPLSACGFKSLLCVEKFSSYESLEARISGKLKCKWRKIQTRI